MADRLLTGQHIPINPEGVVQQLREFQRRTRALAKMTLEEELRSLTSGIGSERNQQIILRRYGWDGGEGATLQEVGESLGLTRERVRQVCDRVERQFEGKSVFTPALDRALTVIEQNMPATIEEIESKLSSEGLSNIQFRLEGIRSAAELFGREVPYILVNAGSKKFALTPGMEGTPSAISQMARRAIEHWGVTTIADVVARAAERTGETINTNVVTHILSGKEDFHWLDETGGWFWLSSVPRNRLLTQIEKILSVAKRIEVSELRAGVSSHYRMKGVAPTKRVLLELCRQTSWCRVEGNTIIADPQPNWEETLSDIEQFMVLMLKEHGPVMQRSKFEDLCMDLGINRVTFYAYLKYSPVIAKYAIGVYGLRGAQIPPGLVESLMPNFKQRRGKVLMDYGWTQGNKIWIGYKISEAMLKSGVIVVPGPMKRFLAGQYTFKTEDGLQFGKLVVRESNGWGLGPFFGRRGGEVGDHLIILVDLLNKEATVYIGDESLLDDFQTDTELIDVSRIDGLEL